MNNFNLYTQIESLPEDLRKEVEDFVQFLLQKKEKKQGENKIERPAGLAKGLIEMKPDFDEPLEDFKEYM